MGSKPIFTGASEQGLHHHFMPMLQPNRTKIVTFNANTQEIVTLDACDGQSDKNVTFNANI